MNVIQRFQGHRYTSKSRQWIFMCLAVLTLISGSLNPVFGQKKSSITITGVVTDAATKEPLAGATVSIKGSSKGTTVDAAGKYSISAPSENAVLEARFIGYASKTVTIGTQTEINFTLAMNASDLEQVIVVGYGTQKKTDVTGSVKSVTSAAFNKGIINSPEQLLQGKVAGVNVTSATGEPGGVQGITVRGPGGIRSGSTPLFVIDGLALDNSTTGGGNPLNFLNPQDIETIDVLKDASATAIYGSRGANGVILVTTKKGKAGVSKLELSTSVGISSIARALPVLSAAEFRKQVVANSGVLEEFNSNTDWQKEITRDALTKNYNLSLGGGADKLTYYAAFGAQM